MSQAATHRKTIVKLLQANAYRHQLWTVFADFVEMAALSISNAIDLSCYDEREARYLDVVKRYDKDEVARFPHMLSELVQALEAEPADQLGMLFGELELGNAARGQFFTPSHICDLMAKLTVADGGEVRRRVAERGFITVQEPAVGAGAMIISMALALHKKGIPYQEQMHVTAVDVDSRAVHMAYVQFSLLHIPAIVILGNTLKLEEREHWRTPAHVLGVWDNKLKRGYALGSALDGAELPTVVDLPIIAVDPERALEQLDLFEAAA